MVSLKWGQSGGTFSAGVYLAEVTACEEKVSQKGDLMFSVKFSPRGQSRALCFDIIMLEGGGWGIGQAKLMMLGFTEADTNVEAADLIGRKAYVALKEDTYNGKTKLAVDIAQGNMGMWREDDEPAGVVVVEEEVPF